ncbi:MAG TPA: hypothetical protein VKA46_42480 [Gemmataceae bacterium]|nr:hypothetical protein [Gemmataceae bacterium]
MTASLPTDRPGTRPGRLARTCAPLVFATFVFLAAGCDSKGTVSGQVTLNGVAVRGGVVTFLGENNVQRVANINADGEYRSDGVPLGVVKVTVTSLATTVPMPRTASLVTKELHGLPQPPAAPPALPRKYANPDNGLSCTVEKGEQKFDIALTP